MILPLDYHGPVSVFFEPLSASILENGVFCAFIKQVHRFSERSAVADHSTSLTYQVLYDRALQLAEYIHRQIEHLQPIGIYLPHQVELPVAMLACLALGVPYVPLDTHFPLNRNKTILHDAKVQLILTVKQFSAVCRDIAPQGCQVIEVDQIVFGSAAYKPTGQGSDIAYVLYTSGSTGNPKGVYQNQQGLLHDVLQYVNAAHINPSDKLTMLYSGSVIGSVRDLFGALLTGAYVRLLSAKELGVSGVLQIISTEHLTILHAVPILYRQLLNNAGARKQFHSVRLVYIAGDRVDVEEARLFQRFFSAGSFLYTGIGSTENATLYRHWFIGTGTELNDNVLPVGRAIPDRFVRLVNEQGCEVEMGEIGEIEVTSRYMALGYWQNEALTNACFKTSPMISGARSFRTGDLGRERDDGLLEFYGRKDSQIKIRGYLIHPGDIEVSAKKFNGVDESAIVVRRGEKGEPVALVMYWSGNDTVTEMQLRRYLTEYLTLPQMPARFYQLQKLPLLANFKIDRQKLSALDKLNQTNSKIMESYGNDSLGRTLKVINEVMATGLVSKEDNLTSLHADSLDVLRIILALEHEFSLTIETEKFLDNFDSVTMLSQYIQHLAKE